MIQRQLGDANLGIASIGLQGIDTSEIIETVDAGPTVRSPGQARVSPQPQRILRRSRSAASKRQPRRRGFRNAPPPGASRATSRPTRLRCLATSGSALEAAAAHDNGDLE